MAKKKAKPLEREERPEFLALLAALPDDAEAMHARAGRVRAVYNDAVIAADDVSLERAALEHDAIVYKLNGGTFFGCRGDDAAPGRVLDAMYAAKPGQVPHWGQGGEFLVEVDGMRARVKYGCEGLRSAPGFDATAVDLEKPYFSETGFRNIYMSVADHMGRTLEQAVRAEIAEQMATDGLVAIKKDDLRWIDKRPQWLTDVLAGVTRDGQLAMFGDQPEPKKPLTGAERQKRRRKKLRELKEQEGLKPVMLTELERLVLRLALDLYNDFNSPSDFEQDHQHGILQKLEPGADWMPPGQRQADRLRSEAAKDAEYWKGLHKEAKAESSRWAKRAQDAERTLRESTGLADRVRYLEQDNAEVIGERGKAFAAVEVLQKRLRAAGLSDDWRA